MSQQNEHPVHEMPELSSQEMMQVQGGDVCHGVSVLAYARVDGVSLAQGDYNTWRQNYGSGG